MKAKLTLTEMIFHWVYKIQFLTNSMSLNIPNTMNSINNPFPPETGTSNSYESYLALKKQNRAVNELVNYSIHSASLMTHYGLVIV